MPTTDGSTISAAISTNGTAWTSLGSTTLAMSTSLFVGLAVSSKNDGVLNTATFDNVLELLVMAGYYRTVGYVANALRLPLEPEVGRPFPKT